MSASTTTKMDHVHGSCRLPQQLEMDHVKMDHVKMDHAKMDVKMDHAKTM